MGQGSVPVNRGGKWSVQLVKCYTALGAYQVQTRSHETTVALDEQLSAKVLSRYLGLAAHAVIPKVNADRKRAVAVSSRTSGGLLFDGLEGIVFFPHLSVLRCATRHESLFEDLHGMKGRCKV